MSQDSPQFPSTAPSPTPPLEHAGPSAQARSHAAGGLSAVANALRTSWREMGPVRAAKGLLSVNQRNGFDCQSCAWPNPDQARSLFEFCENGAKAVADEATTKRVGPEFFRRHSVADLAARADHWLNQQGRLTTPMVLRPGATHYEPIAWADAFSLLGNALRRLPTPDAAAFYTSGRTSNEAAFLYQLFARAFGTNNLPDCSNLCHESSGAALSTTIGIGKGCVTLDDFDRADAIFILGQNPGTNHPRMLTALQSAKRRGCRIVTLNPLPEVGTERFINPQDLKHPLRAPGVLVGAATTLSDLWLPVRIGGDLAALQGIIKALLEAEDARPGTIVDRSFVDTYTTGFDALTERVRGVSWSSLERSSGLTRTQMEAAARVAIEAKSVIACWAMGLTQHRAAVATIQEVINFLLLRGNIGRPGAGPCPVRGHSNVQGDRTVGICERPSAAFLDALGREFGFEPPRHHGFDVVHTIRAMHEGRVRVLFALGGNFLSATPDTDYTAEALRRCEVTAHVSTKLNRAHLVTGRTGLILPTLGRSERDLAGDVEQFVTVEDSMGIISASRGVFPPASDDLLSEIAIVARLAQATLSRTLLADWTLFQRDYGTIRDRIERVVPGFERYNERAAHAPFYLPNPVREGRRFPTGDGRARFTVHELPAEIAGPGEYVMMTIRSHDQFNTTIYGLDDRYRGIFNGRRVVFMNAEDMAAANLTAGQFVDLRNTQGGRVRIAPQFMVAVYPIPRGCVATYFPEANVLVPIDSVAETSNTPTSKSVPVTIHPSSDTAEAASRWRSDLQPA